MLRGQGGSPMTRLLLIDDDARLAAMVADYLRAAGYAVDTAATLGAARERMRGGYDALVLDLMLPDGDGLDYTRELRADAATRRLPLLMLSAAAPGPPARAGTARRGRALRGRGLQG
jgi:DNA-binding response OmpR family regulator